MVDATKNVRSMSYAMSVVSLALIVASFQMYPMNLTDMDHGGCIVKLEGQRWKNRTDYLKDIKHFPWSADNGVTGPDSSDKFTSGAVHGINVRMSNVAKYGMIAAAIALAIASVHFLDSFYRTIMSGNDDDETPIQSFEAPYVPAGLLFYIFNVLGMIFKVIAMTLIVLMFSGGACPYGSWDAGNTTKMFPDDNLDWEDDARHAYLMAFIAVGVEILGIVILGLMTTKDINPINADTETTSMGAWLAKHIGNFVAFTGFVLIVVGASVLMAHPVDMEKSQDNCVALYNDRRGAPPSAPPPANSPEGNDTEGSGQRDRRSVEFPVRLDKGQFRPYDPHNLEDDSWVVEIYLVMLMISAAVLLLSSGYDLVVQCINDNSTLDRKPFAMIRTIVLAAGWFTFFLSLGGVLYFWMMSATTGCSPLWTAKAPPYAPTLVVAGTGMIFGVGFMSRGYSSYRTDGEKLGATRMSLASGMGSVF